MASMLLVTSVEGDGDGNASAASAVAAVRGCCSCHTQQQRSSCSGISSSNTHASTRRHSVALTKWLQQLPKSVTLRPRMKLIKGCTNREKFGQKLMPRVHWCINEHSHFYS